jgi:hypothetical protein
VGAQQLRQQVGQTIVICFEPLLDHPSDSHNSRRRHPFLRALSQGDVGRRVSNLGGQAGLTHARFNSAPSDLPGKPIRGLAAVLDRLGVMQAAGGRVPR